MLLTIIIIHHLPTQPPLKEQKKKHQQVRQNLEKKGQRWNSIKTHVTVKNVTPERHFLSPSDFLGEKSQCLRASPSRRRDFTLQNDLTTKVVALDRHFHHDSSFMKFIIKEKFWTQSLPPSPPKKTF